MDALLNIRVIRCSVSFMLSDLRSNRPEVFSKKGVIKNFTKFTGKHLCQSQVESIQLIKLQTSGINLNAG